MEKMEVASWSDFKTLVTSKALLPQYVEGPDRYDIFATEHGEFSWQVSVLKDTTDGDDFEDNYKAGYNKPLEIKAGAGRTERVCVSPQPNNTVEKWKGYEISCGDSDSSVSIDISFGTKIYLRGGEIKSKDVVNGDKFKAEIQMQIGGVWTTVMTPMEDIYLLPSMRETVKGDDCMEFPTTYRLKITFTPVSTGTAKKIYIVLDYYV